MSVICNFSYHATRNTRTWKLNDKANFKLGRRVRISWWFDDEWRLSFWPRACRFAVLEVNMLLLLDFSIFLCHFCHFVIYCHFNSRSALKFIFSLVLSKFTFSNIFRYCVHLDFSRIVHAKVLDHCQSGSLQSDLL